MRIRGFAIVAAALLPLLFVPSGATPLKRIETEEMRLVYFEGAEDYLVPYVGQCFGNSMEFQRRLWEYRPTQPVTVLLADFTDRGNAAASSVPRNLLMLQIAPLGFDYETVSANERMNWLMNHELVHVSAGDNAAKNDLFFRKLFAGKVLPNSDNPESIAYFYLTSPRDAAPSWYHEGIAVFVETWMAGGRGRAQGVYDEMVFRSMVRDGSRFYDPLGLVSEGTKVDFMVGVNSYLYGTRFMSFLADQYTPEKLIDWISRSRGNKKYYASQFKEVYGKSIEEAWGDWVTFERAFQETNLESIREYPITPHRDLSPRALGSISRAHFDPETGELYAGFHYPGVVAHIGAISLEDGSVEKLIDVKDPVIFAVTSMAYDADSKTIFYTTDNLEYRDVRALDPETGKARTLLKDVRIGDLAFNQADDSLWGVRHYNGITTLVRIPAPYEEWTQIYSWPYGDVMYGIDVSPDGTLLSASVGEVDGRHSLRVWRIEDLMEKRTEPVAELDFGNTIPSDFRFTHDGRYLYGSSYYTGVSNIFRYEWQTDELEGVSNTETGLFRPIPLEDGSLIVFRYTGRGFVPSMIDPEPLEDVNPILLLGQQVVERNPILKEWNVGSPAEVPFDSMITDEGRYHGFKSIGLESVYPILQGYKDYGAVGARINFSDPLSLNKLTLKATYTPNSNLPSDERAHAEVRFERYNWWAELAYNPADFYDLFGPTKVGRKGQFVGAGWDKLLIYDKPRRMELNVAATFFNDIDTLPRYQNIPAPFDQISALSGKLSYSHVRSSLGAVDGEKGHIWQLASVNKYVDGDLIPNFVGTFDAGIALPLKHSSIWFRTAAGVAFGEQDDAFANFYFGGFGNNYVDHQEIKRYREFYSFPGVELNEVFGRNFGKLMLEWNLPPLRFRNAGTPGFYASWMRTSLFANALATNLDDSTVKTEIGDVGVQVDFKFSALSRLPMTLSFGYAAAFESGLSSRDEWMVSLSIVN